MLFYNLLKLILLNSFPEVNLFVNIIISDVINMFIYGTMLLLKKFVNKAYHHLL